MASVITFTHDQVREEDLIHCIDCKAQIAFVEDHHEIVQNGRTGVFNSVFNVELLDRENYLRKVNDNIVADVYCGRCGRLLGLKLVVVPRPSLEVSEGRYLMKLCKLVYWNDYPMLSLEVNDPQDGDVDIDQLLNELNGGANVEQVPNEKVGGANVEQVPNEQVGGANIKRDPNPGDQDGGSSEQVPNEQVADEPDGGANIEQVPNEQVTDEPDGGANIEQVPSEQVADEPDGDANIEQAPNEQVADQPDGGANIEQVANEQDGGANEQDPNDQDGVAAEQDPNQDVAQLADGLDNIDLNLNI